MNLVAVFSTATFNFYCHILFLLPLAVEVFLVLLPLAVEVFLVLLPLAVEMFLVLLPVAVESFSDQSDAAS